MSLTSQLITNITTVQDSQFPVVQQGNEHYKISIVEKKKGQMMLGSVWFDPVSSNIFPHASYLVFGTAVGSSIGPTSILFINCYHVMLYVLYHSPSACLIFLCVPFLNLEVIGMSYAFYRFNGSGEPCAHLIRLPVPSSCSL